jgi:hypothetical protein
LAFQALLLVAVVEALVVNRLERHSLPVLLQQVVVTVEHKQTTALPVYPTLAVVVVVVALTLELITHQVPVVQVSLLLDMRNKENR